MRPVLFLSLMFSFGLVCFARPAQAQDDAQKTELLNQAKALEARAGEVQTQETKTLEAAAGFRQKLLEVQQAVIRLKRLVEETQKTVTDQDAALKKQQEEAAKAEEARKQAAAVAEAAAKALAEAQQKLEAAKKAADEATAAAAKSMETVKATTGTLAEAKAKNEEAARNTSTTETELASLQTKLTETDAAARKASEERVALLKQAEALRSQAGEWVSFAAEVAPVFHKRCLACHNARTAKGRFNMESYAAIMKGGESGAAIEPGNGELSGLCAMIEDGSMPKDADPLTPDQIAIVKRWVSLGARLDAGKDANAPLIQIMPKFPQPNPPEVYTVPIPITALGFSPDGALLASSGYHEVILWSTTDGSLQKRFHNVAERVYDIAFHPDGSRLAVAAGTPGQIGEVKVFNLADGQLVADLVTVEDAMFGVKFSPDGTRLAACGADRSIRIYDVATWNETHLIEDHADWVLGIAWSPDGNKLVSASRDKTSKVFDAKSGDALITFNGHGEVVASAAVLSDNAHAVTCGRDKRVRVWTLADGKETKSITGFGDEVSQLTLLPDDRILTACADRKVRCQKSDGNTVATYEGHQDWVYSVAAHAGSGKLASGSYDGEIRIWSIDDPKSVTIWKAAPGYVSPDQASK